MKTKLIILLISTLFFTCDKKTEKQDLNQVAIEINKELTINMEFQTNKDDDFIFIMNNIVVDEFQTKSIQIKESITATSFPDNFTARFGENNISRKFEIDLGRRELKEVEILSIKFEYGNKSIVIPPKDLEKYFAFSKFSILDSITKKITTKKTDNYHFPKLYAKSVLWDELMK